MTNIPAALRRLVIQRANNRCEYCGISQIGQVATFHIDHVIPVVAGFGKSLDFSGGYGGEVVESTKFLTG